MADIKIPDKIFGIDTKEAYKKVMAKQNAPVKKEKEVNTNTPLVNIKNPQDYVQIPNTDKVISKYELKEFNDLNWNDAHFKLAENSLFMPSPALFMPYFKNVIEAYDGKITLYDGLGKAIQKNEVKDIYNHLTKNRIIVYGRDSKGCWTWLDALFITDNGMKLKTDHRVINNKLEGKTYSLESCLNEDCYVDLKFNKQGLAIQKCSKQKYKQGENIYFYKPREGYVAWFVAGSGRADLVCVGDPDGSGSSLGVRAVREK